jgi:EAL domain-containing protein (putative c-di-GMP-specific phosphodiesterase class I)
LKQPDGTLLAAADFIEEAETLGLARPLDRRALELALDLLAAHPALKLSLNISSLTAGDKDWLATLEAASARHPGLTERLTVEITETAMIHDLDEIASFVDLLRASGCKVAIDDFGAGYTSFRHLKSLHVDMLKIDGMFMSNLPNDHQARVLVKTMIEIAQAFGLETVAEWVSDEETAIFLRSVGITYLQGFLHGSPITVDEMKRRGLL